MAFGAVAINQQAQQAPGGDNHDHEDDEDDGDDGLSNNNFASNPNNNNSNTNDAGRRLAQFRENFNAENIRKSSKSGATFNKHQSNHERLLVWLFINKPDYLHPDFKQELTDADATVDYQVPSRLHTKYVQQGGQKSLEERMREYRMTILRKAAKSALGTPGMPPARPTVRLEALENDVNCFLDFLSSIRKDKSGALLKAGAYTAFRSSLTYLFHRYKYVPSRAYERDIQEAMEGVKRISTQAAQAGEGNLWDGDCPLPWGLYEQLNRWFYAEGTDDGIFAATFSKLTCNLACRGNSTAQVCTKHMKWVDDCIQIPFAHGKDQQRGMYSCICVLLFYFYAKLTSNAFFAGDNQLKKLPRHCYANPLNFASDLPSTLFHYFVTNPTIIAEPEEALFPGVLKSQAQKFGNILSYIKKKYKTIIERDYGISIDDIGVHSLRKCAHSKLNTGSTAGPSGAAACLRGGHSMGKNRDVYIAQEKASDTYCGRILQGLPEHSPEFAVSYPDFVPIDLKQSLENGVSATELAERQKVVDHQVQQALVSIFGEENLRAFPSIQRLLRVGLASHLIHFDSYNQPVYATDPRPILPPSAALRMTALFTNPAIQSLKQHVAVAMPWENHYTYFKPASGLPPHVILYAYIKGLDIKLDGLPKMIEDLLDKRQMAGPLSLDQIARAVENGPVMRAMAADLASLRARSIRESGADAGVGDSTTPRMMARLHRQYNHPDGKSRRVPPSWTIPKLSFQAVYQYWHCGDEANNIPPMKYLTKSDVDYLGRGARIRLSEMRKLVAILDNEATVKGHAPKQYMTLAEANTCYYHGEKAVLAFVPAKTPKGRSRVVSMMKWTTVVKYTHKKRVSVEQEGSEVETE
jgi:hypothetical protein